MKTAASALERIGNLAAQDRAWILRNLSPAAQIRLRQQALQERAGETKKDESGPERILDQVEGEQIAQTLAAEPPWIIATVLGLRSWSWEAALLARLTPVSRREVSQLRLSAQRVSPSMRELLLRCLRERLGSAPAVSAAFDRLLHAARGMP